MKKKKEIVTRERFDWTHNNIIGDLRYLIARSKTAPKRAELLQAAVKLVDYWFSQKPGGVMEEKEHRQAIAKMLSKALPGKKPVVRCICIGCGTTLESQYAPCKCDERKRNET